ncbi:MAG: T9SS type A sorting domain-containing protein [Chitinophagaceae bacterium]|nr:T9SS type A sorting domain-containing protein [Chitinophagaceae bacterium]
MQLYPNPVKDQLSISLRSSEPQMVSISFTDLAGKQIKRENRNIFTGENNIMLNNLSNFLKGVYLIAVHDAGGNLISSTKFLKD